MDLYAIPTWKEAVNDVGLKLDFFIKSHGWDPLFIVEILKCKEYETCKYFMICDHRMPQGTSIYASTYGKIPSVSFDEIFGQSIYSKIADLDLVHSNVNHVKSFTEALVYTKNMVYPYEDIKESIRASYRSINVIL